MLYLLTYLLNLFDLICTNYWITQYGLSIEANPIGRWLYENHLAVQVKVFMVGLMLLVLYDTAKHGEENTAKLCDIASLVMFVAYAILAVYHILLLTHIIL